jgi:hypothetical protein
MELFVYVQKIEFELENDKNSFDIIKSIANFCITLRPQQFLSKILVNGNEYLFENETELKKILINDINKIEIDTTDIVGQTILLINNFEEMIKYISTIINGGNWNDEYKEIYKSLELLKDGIEKIDYLFKNEEPNFPFSNDYFNESYKPLHKLFINLSKERYPLGRDATENSNENIKNISNMIKNIKEWLKNVGYINSIEDLHSRALTLKDDINEIIPKLSNVSLLFQTGSDKEAMQIIQDFTSILEKSIKIFANCKGNKNEEILKEMDFENFFSTLTLNLKELMTSIENRDSVMIGDLIEYEFIPKIKNKKNMLKKIK